MLGQFEIAYSSLAASTCLLEYFGSSSYSRWKKGKNMRALLTGQCAGTVS